MSSHDIKVSIRFVDPMFRIRVEEPDGTVNVYGGRSIQEASKKLKDSRALLQGILLGQGLDADPWELDLLKEVDRHVSEFCG